VITCLRRNKNQCISRDWLKRLRIWRNDIFYYTWEETRGKHYYVTTMQKKRRIINGKRVYESATKHKPFFVYCTIPNNLSSTLYPFIQKSQIPFHISFFVHWWIPNTLSYTPFRSLTHPKYPFIYPFSFTDTSQIPFHVPFFVHWYIPNTLHKGIWEG